MILQNVIRDIKHLSVDALRLTDYESNLEIRFDNGVIMTVTVDCEYDQHKLSVKTKIPDYQDEWVS